MLFFSHPAVLLILYVITQALADRLKTRGWKDRAWSVRVASSGAVTNLNDADIVISGAAARFFSERQEPPLLDGDEHEQQGGDHRKEPWRSEHDDQKCRGGPARYRGLVSQSRKSAS